MLLKHHELLTSPLVPTDLTHMNKLEQERTIGHIKVSPLGRRLATAQVLTKRMSWIGGSITLALLLVDAVGYDVIHRMLGVLVVMHDPALRPGGVV